MILFLDVVSGSRVDTEPGTDETEACAAEKPPRIGLDRLK